MARTIGKSHSGGNMRSGGLLLDTTLKSLIMPLCCLTGILSTQSRETNTEDNNDLYSAIVLYLYHLSYKDA